MENRQFEAMERHLNNAYNHMDKMSVSGGNVDMLAIARQEMRELWKLLQEAKKDKNTEE